MPLGMARKMFRSFRFEGEEPLPEVVEDDEQPRAEEHGQVALELLAQAEAAQEPAHHRLSQAQRERQEKLKEAEHQ